MAKLEQELAEVETKVAELTEETSHCDQKSRELDSRQQELRQQIYQADSERAEVNAQWQQASSQLQRTTAEAPLIAGEIESMNRQIVSAKERQTECEEVLRTLEEEQKKVEAVVHELGAQLIVRQHEVSELAEAATRARVAMGQVQEQRSGVSRELATARQAVSQAQMEIQRLAGEIEAVAGRIADAEATVCADGAEVDGVGGEDCGVGGGSWRRRRSMLRRCGRIYGGEQRGWRRFRSRLKFSAAGARAVAGQK